MKRKNMLIPIIVGLATLLMLGFQIIPYFSDLFKLELPGWKEWGVCLSAAALGTLWMEPLKVLAKGKLP